MKKVLIIPPHDGWYMREQAEYLIRHLSDEFFIEVADVPYPPYNDFLSRFPETHPLQRNPDEYDLLIPLLATHWVVTEKEKYRHKIAQIWYQPNEGDADNIAGLAITTPLAERSAEDKKFHRVRFGIDTDLFKPLHFKKDNKILHVGMVGNLYNPRRMTKYIVEALKNIPRTQILLFVNQRPKTEHDLELLGGKHMIDYIVSGEKSPIGLANIYNSLDVLIRCDSDPGYSFPVLEAASCGIPVIATDSGIDHLITESGGGFLIPGNRDYYLNNPHEVADKVMSKIIFLRDNEKIRVTMGIAANYEIYNNWRWEKHIQGWREFFRDALKNSL